MHSEYRTSNCLGGRIVRDLQMRLTVSTTEREGSTIDRVPIARNFIAYRVISDLQRLTSTHAWYSVSRARRVAITPSEFDRTLEIAGSRLDVCYTVDSACLL